MPLFLFRIEDGGLRPETLCVELAGLNEARAEAVRLVGQAMRDDPTLIVANESCAITVTDDEGIHLFSLSVTASKVPAVAYN